MATLTVDLDARTAEGLSLMSQREGIGVARVAARLLARAVRAARPRPTYAPEELKAAYARLSTEDEALAKSGLAERADLLAREDEA